MNKLIITLVIATLALSTFAQERERMYRYGRGPRRDWPQEGGRRRPNPDAKPHRFSATASSASTPRWRASPTPASGYPNVTFRVVREEH